MFEHRSLLAGLTVGARFLAILLLVRGREGDAAQPGTGAVSGEVPDWEPGEAPGHMGISYKRPTGAPKVSKEQAIAAANQEGIADATAPLIAARHELMTAEGKGMWRELLRAAGLGSAFTDVPVWVISYEGVNVSSSGPPPVPEDTTSSSEDVSPLVNRETNIIISAENGAYLGAFSYR